MLHVSSKRATPKGKSLPSQKKRHNFSISHKQGKERNKNSFQNQNLQALPWEKPLIKHYGMEAEVGIEPTHRAFAEPCLTTWLLRLNF